MYTPHALFSGIFLQICCFMLSLYIVGLPVTVLCDISVKSPVIFVNSHYVSEDKVWSVNRINRCRDVAV